MCEVDDHVLVKIFKNTNNNERLSLMLVNKRFNQLISNTKILMEGISVVWESQESDTLGKLDDFLGCMLQSGRAYQKLKIDFDKGQFLKSFLILHKFHKSITELDISGKHIDLEDLAKLINGFPNLETLTSYCEVNEIIPSGIKLKLNKLKNLSCEMANILYFEVVPDLVRLEIEADHYVNFDAIEKIKTILLNLHNLEVLTIPYEIDCDEIFVTNLKFKLKKLDISAVDGCGDATRFVRSQKYLKDLTINFGTADENFGVTGSFMEVILKQKFLEFLHIMFTGDPQYLDTHIDAEANPSIKNFRVDYYDVQNSILFHNMIRRMPNLEELCFLYSPKFCREDADLLNSLKMLETLSIKITTKDSVLPELKFPNLLEASFGFDVPENEEISFVDTEELIKFLRNHLNLAMLKIFDANIQEEVWKFVKQNLRNLEIFEIRMQKEKLQKMPFLQSDSEFQVKIDDFYYLARVLVERIE